MILEFVKGNLLKVVNATEAEMLAVMSKLTAKVSNFRRRGHQDWNGDVKFFWFMPTTDQELLNKGINGFWYLPASAWKRLMDLRQPDPQELRPAYEVEFIGKENFFNYDITLEDVKSFVESLEPPFEDYFDQIQVLYMMLVYRMSSHNISTGFGKTYVSFLLAQYTKQVYEGKTLVIAPRTDLVSQGIGDMHDYQKHLEIDRHLQVYGVAGGIRNYCKIEEADIVFGTFQSLVNMPDDWFLQFTTVVADEGHTAKAISIRDTICRCQNAQIITAISGTMKYGDQVDLMTIESYCGPIVSDYPARAQIDKGRLPKIAIQPIQLIHDTSHKLNYETRLQVDRLPVPYNGYPSDLAATYRRIEFRYLGECEEMFEYILKLCSQYTEQGKNILVIFTNQTPAINMFQYANDHGIKCHLIFGGTDKRTRREIKAQIENEGGWILAATTGTMSMGVSINNLHGAVICMAGHSPHVILQSLGRMLRNHPDKYDITVIYDIFNDIQAFGSKFDLSNYKSRLKYYRLEQHPVYELHSTVV